MSDNPVIKVPLAMQRNKELQIMEAAQFAAGLDYSFSTRAAMSLEEFFGKGYGGYLLSEAIKFGFNLNAKRVQK